jgi:hypothetical protein
MDGASQGTYNWILSHTTTEPSGPVPNFVYISVIPDGFQNEPGAIYNYDPAETQTLLNMQVGESRSLRDDPNIAPWFTYTRLPDTTLGNQTAQANRGGSTKSCSIRSSPHFAWRSDRLRQISKASEASIGLISTALSE